MKINKQLILNLGFVIQDENPVGFLFIHPRFNNIEYAFFYETIHLVGTNIEFKTLEHFIFAHQALSLHTLSETKMGVAKATVYITKNEKKSDTYINVYVKQSIDFNCQEKEN